MSRESGDLCNSLSDICISKEMLIEHHNIHNRNELNPKILLNNQIDSNTTIFSNVSTPRLQTSNNQINENISRNINLTSKINLNENDKSNGRFFTDLIKNNLQCDKDDKSESSNDRTLYSKIEEKVNIKYKNNDNLLINKNNDEHF